MYQNSIETIRQSIFPVFFEVRQGSQTRIGVSGSAFFISENVFVTANHVITDTPPGARILYAGNIPNNAIQPVEFEEVLSDPVQDIYFGRVPEDIALNPLDLAEENPRAGKSVCLCGYPFARLGQNPNGSINANNVRPYWQPTFVVDSLTANNVEGRTYQGFITQHTSLKGMSGGPVFDTDAIVHGIDVATFTREIPEGDGQVTRVPNGVVVGIQTLHDLLEEID